MISILCQDSLANVKGKKKIFDKIQHGKSFHVCCNTMFGICSTITTKLEATSFATSW